MTLLASRGGVPHVLRATIDTTGRRHQLPQVCSYLIAKATTDAIRIFFTEADFTANANYVVIAADGEWRGPVEAKVLWFKAAATSGTLELVTFSRLG